LSRTFAKELEKKLQERNERIDWDAVQRLGRDPHGVPVPVVGSAITLETVLADAMRVRNAVPSGATWNAAQGGSP
jgi:hypothetical protein